jgi:hypothetical protein
MKKYLTYLFILISLNCISQNKIGIDIGYTYKDYGHYVSNFIFGLELSRVNVLKTEGLSYSIAMRGDRRVRDHNGTLFYFSPNVKVGYEFGEKKVFGLINGGIYTNVLLSEYKQFYFSGTPKPVSLGVVLQPGIGYRLGKKMEICLSLLMTKDVTTTYTESILLMRPGISTPEINNIKVFKAFLNFQFNYNFKKSSNE